MTKSRLRSIFQVFTLVAAALLSTATTAAAEDECGWMMAPLAVLNAGFEDPANGTPVPMWCTEGADVKGVDRAVPGYPRSGSNNAFIEATSTWQWNALSQRIFLDPSWPNYELRAWIQTSGNVTDGYFGVRAGNTMSVHSEIKFGNIPGYQELVVRFGRGNLTDATIFAGFWSPGDASWLMIDDVRMYRV